MKAIIKGKTYNTDTAEKITSGYIQSNNYHSSTLYLTKKGNYFVCNYSNSCYGDNGIYLLDDPVEWIEAWAIDNLEEREMIAFGIEEG